MTSPTVHGTQPKRRKVAVACEHCRIKKARCDGIKPVCGTCSSRSQHCVYKVSAAEGAQTIEYVESLHSRIVQLEQELAATRNSLHSRHTAAGSCEQSQPDHFPHGRENSPGISVDSNLFSTSGAVDAMGGSLSVDDVSTAPGKFYGSSSTSSFSRQVYTDILRRPVGTTSMASSQQPRTEPRPLITCGTTAEDLALLPRNLSDYLMTLYWNRVHALYPFLHQRSFKNAYEDAWKPSKDHSPRNRPGLGLGASNDSGPLSLVFNCALNAALALGVEFSSLEPAEKENIRLSCMTRAKKLLSLDLFDEGSMSLVQTLLILTQLFQSTTCPSKCWTSIGVAYRLAQGLGLHIDENRFHHQFDVMECELRRRVWHGCVTLDIAVSMALGRPGSLSSNVNRSLPEAMENDDDWVYVPGCGAERFCLVTFYTQSIKLYSIVECILTDIYKLNTESKDHPSASNGHIGFDDLIKIEERLTQFAHDLPKALSFPEDIAAIAVDVELQVLRQRNVLYVRFLHARVLLYRHIFFRYCRATTFGANSQPSATSALVDQFMYQSALTCVRTSVDLIGAVKHTCGTEATGAWWYNLFYIREAAFILLLVKLCPRIVDSIGSNVLTSAWLECQEVLSCMLPQQAVVRDGLAALITLQEHVTRQLGRAETTIDANRSIPRSPQVRGENSVPLNVTDPQADYLTFLMTDQFQFDVGNDPLSLFGSRLDFDLLADT